MLKKQSTIFFPSSATPSCVSNRAAGARDLRRAYDPAAATTALRAAAQGLALEQADRAQTAAADQARTAEATASPLSAPVLPVAAVALLAAAQAVQGAQAPA